MANSEEYQKAIERLQDAIVERLRNMRRKPSVGILSRVFKKLRSLFKRH